MAEEQEQAQQEDPENNNLQEQHEDYGKILIIKSVALADIVVACCLLTFYGQMYFFGHYFWPTRCIDDPDCASASVTFWDFELIEGATWFGIFVVHSFQLLSAIYLCPTTYELSRENLQERCRSWLYSSKILIKILIFECFILFIPHRKPLIFKWWLFLIKAIFRGLATTIIAHFMIGWMEQDRSSVRANTHSTTIIPILSARTFRTQRGRNMNTLTTTSIYMEAGLDYADDGTGSARICEEEPPPSYNEAIKSSKNQAPLYLHV